MASSVMIAATPRDEAFREDVKAELVRYLYRQAPGALVAMFAAGCILTYTLWDTVAHERLLGWLLGLVAVCALRLAQVGAFLRHPPPKERATRWAVASAAGSTLIGAVWAAACFMFLDPAQPISLITITVILMGICAGAVVHLASYLPSFWVVIGPSMGALIIVLLRHGDFTSNIVALLATVATVAYFGGARNVHRLLTESLQLSFENLALRREAEEKTALLEATLQNMRQGISLSDANGCLRMWNPQFVELLGVSGTAVGEGVPIRQILSGARPPLNVDGTQRAEYRRDDGGVVEVAQNAMPDGGRVVTYADITDLKRREAALEAARRSAEQANAAKTRFLAAASHDLRQPIHALGLLFATLAESVRDARTAPLLKQIDSAFDAVDSMLTSLLDISKLDAGVVRPHVGPVDLAALLQRLDDEHQPIARVTGNRLRVRPADAVVASDAAMLHRILANLVSNALRYTIDGRVLVGARRRGRSIRIDVYDDGPGIPEDSLEDIFLEFHQLGNPERDRRKGLGLGLAIVKRLADLLGHRIEVRSALGRGSRFSVTLPASAEARPSAARGPLAAAPGADLHGKRVLLLDDEVAVLDAMSSLLERWGCEVTTTAAPEEAEAALASSSAPPDMLIVDYRLRRHASGIETIGRLHQVAGHRIPALVITGDTAPDRLREAQESGYPLLHKPVKPAELRAVMRQLISDETAAARSATAQGVR
jgi:signal transduction histidine kinase/ActR/RegA family two-component response regulator